MPLRDDFPVLSSELNDGREEQQVLLRWWQFITVGVRIKQSIGFPIVFTVIIRLSSCLD